MTDTSYPVAKFLGGLRALSGRALALEMRLSLRVASALLAAMAIILAAILLLCDGHLIYGLDDSYISLSLGWHIGHGHYGINDADLSSPSSSILYPFVLAGLPGPRCSNGCRSRSTRWRQPASVPCSRSSSAAAP